MEDFLVRESLKWFSQNWRVHNSRDVCYMSKKKTTKETTKQKRDPIGYKGELRTRLEKE